MPAHPRFFQERDGKVRNGKGNFAVSNVLGLMPSPFLKSVYVRSFSSFRRMLYHTPNEAQLDEPSQFHSSHVPDVLTYRHRVASLPPKGQSISIKERTLSRNARSLFEK